MLNAGCMTYSRYFSHREGIVGACKKDILHTFCCYKALQRELFIGSSGKLDNFTERLSSTSRKLVKKESEPFGHNFLQVVITVINLIAASKVMS